MPRVLRVLSSATVALFGLVAWLAWDSSADHGLVVVGLLVASALPMTAAALLVSRRPLPNGALGWIFAAGVIIRVAFLFHEPYLSDDVYRYLWDGRVQLAGLSPYGVAPDDPALDGVEENFAPERRVRQHVNHGGVPTIYPPLLEVVFHAVALADFILAPLALDPLVIWRLLLLGAEMGLAVLIVACLANLGRDRRLVVLYLWHPLPVIESAWNAHAESIAVLLFFAALWLLGSHHRVRGGIALGFAAATKLLPAGLLLYLWRRAGTVPAALAIGAITLCALPFISTEFQKATAGLRTYVESWCYNDILFHPLGSILGIDVDNRLLAETQSLRRGLYLAMVTLALAAGLFVRDSMRAGLCVAGIFVLLTPTLHPWYLLWVLPCAITLMNRAWLLLTITIFFSYFAVVGARRGGAWEVPTWIKACEFIPPLVWLGAEKVRSLFGRRAQPETP